MTDIIAIRADEPMATWYKLLEFVLEHDLRLFKMEPPAKLVPRETLELALSMHSSPFSMSLTKIRCYVEVKDRAQKVKLQLATGLIV